MPDVGVLNLQIHDNAEKAAQGLESLIGALNRVKSAVDIGSKLGNIATNLGKIGKIIDESIQGSTIAKLNEIGTALEKMKNIGKVNIRISYGKEDEFAAVAKVFEQTEAYSHGVAVDAHEAGDGFADAAEKVAKVTAELREATELVQNLNWTAGGLEEAFGKGFAAWNNLRMSRSIGSGDGQGGGFLEAAQGWESWKDGAIEAEGTVTDAADVMNGRLLDMSSGIAGYLEGVGGAAEEIKTTTEQIAEGMAEVGDSVKEVSFAPMNEQLQQVTESLDEALRKRRELNEQEDFEIKSRNYPALREAALDDGGNVARNMLLGYGLTQEAIEKCETYAEALKMTMGEVNQAVDEFANKTNQPAGSMFQESAEVAAEVAAAQPEVASVDTSGLSTAIELQEKLAEATPNMEQFEQTERSARDTSDRLRYSLVGLDKEVKNKEMDFGNASRAASLFRVSLADIRRDAGRLISPLTNLGTQFANIARRMAIRAIIRQFTSALSEGVQNVYMYSSAIGGHFANSMDSASTALAQMRNSIGAALAPAIEALIPILNTVVSWFITAINYVNQFFALLRGQATWIRALEVSTKAYDKSTKQAQKTAKAAKELLADWDELNIIQSESGGGGTGGLGVDLSDYSKMFEEVGEYAQWVKDLVGAIKDQFGDVLTLVKKIGVALLGWALASNFTGALGVLGGLLAGGAVIDLVFNIVQMFDKKFLKTGDVGWLIGDLLTTLVGSFFMNAIFERVLGEGAGEIGIALTFAISAAASIVSNIQDTDVSALSKESLLLSLESALKGGTAAGFIAHFTGASIGESLLGGAVGALATFGIALTLKADAQIVADDITQENLTAALGGIASLGIAGAITGARVGGTAAAAAGMSMLFGGAAITTLGVAIGINAVNTTAEAGEITKEVIEKNLLSGGIIGAGLALVAGSVIGSGAVVAIAAVGGAALAIGALFAIEATIAESASKVEWGNYEATKEEIEAFVEQELFATPPSVTISTIQATLEPNAELKDSLTKSAETMLGTIYAAKIGVSTTPEEMNAQVDAVVAGFNELTKQSQKTLEVGLSIVPRKGADGEDLGAGIVKSSADGWSELTGIMTSLGQELADAYKVAYDAKLAGNIDENAEYTIKKISEMMARVTAAISTGEVKAKAVTTIREQMGDLSKESMDGILAVYREQRDLLLEEMLKIRKESAEGFLSQQFAYEELAKYALQDAGGDVNDETYLHYMEMAKKAKEQYDLLIETMNKDAEDAADEMMNGDEREKLREALLKAIVSPLNPENLDIGRFFADAGYGDIDLISAFIQGLLKDQNTEYANEEMNTFFENLLMSLVGLDNLGTYKEAIDLGILKWSDLFNQEVVDTLKRAILGENYSEELGQLWDERIAALFGDTPKIENDVEIDTTVHEDIEIVTEETTDENGISRPLGDLGPFEEYGKSLEEAKEITTDTLKEINEMKLTPPKFDPTDIQQNAGDTATSIENMADRIRGAFQRLDGLSFSFNTGSQVLSGLIRTVIPIPAAANGAIFKSGDVFSANENGRTELIGSYGNKTAVVNNDQVVGAVTNGVAQANSGMESRLGTIETLLNRILQKEFTARAVPSSGWGAHAARSADAYSKVTG